MSSSTLSITAHPTPTPLRRHTLTTHTKTSLNPTNSNETNIMQTKNPNPTTPTTKLLKKTVVKRPKDKSPLKPVINIVIKNLSLVVVMLVLIEMIRRLAVRRTGAFDFGLVNPSFGYERRMAEVEEMVMGIEKMMQVRIDVLNRKVASEVSRLRSELGNKIDGGRDEVLGMFGEFDGRIGSMERLLTSSEWLSKDEFYRFVEGLNRGKGIGEIKWEEIRAFVRGIVENEIGKHAADGIGRVDYAVASGGARVVRHSEGFGGRRGVGGGWFSGSVRNDAVKMLQPSFGQPGECFPLKGDSGFVEVRLRSPIVPEAVTLEHVSKSVAFDRSTAPKDCKVWGWSRNEGNTQKEHLLTEFTYDLEKSSSQTFNVLLDTEGVNSIIIDTIRLQFMSNHGSATHTCIYRLRVHGHQPDVS